MSAGVERDDTVHLARGKSLEMLIIRIIKREDVNVAAPDLPDPHDSSSDLQGCLRVGQDIEVDHVRAVLLQVDEDGADFHAGDQHLDVAPGIVELPDDLLALLLLVLIFIFLNLKSLKRLRDL